MSRHQGPREGIYPEGRWPTFFFFGSPKEVGMDLPDELKKKVVAVPAHNPRYKRSFVINSV